MIRQGDIYAYTDPLIPPHPVVVVSREELNRGDRVLAAIVTSAKFAVRAALPNCVAVKAG
jgi:mRNA-degrading endonuclease toxin of MazEF toxin-antitoxin module